MSHEDFMLPDQVKMPPNPYGRPAGRLCPCRQATSGIHVKLVPYKSILYSNLGSGASIGIRLSTSQWHFHSESV